MTITDMFVSDAFREAMANSGESSENGLGCDLSQMIPALEAQLGVPNENPFKIIKTDENAGILQIGDDGDSGTFTLVYTPSTGTMTVHYEADGAAFDGVLTAKYNSDKTGVEISGPMETDLGMGAENIKVTITIAGSKPLSA